MAEHARVAGQSRQVEAIHAEVSHDQRHHARQRCQRDAGKHTGDHTRQQLHAHRVAALRTQRVKVTRLAQQRQLRAMGDGAAHRHKQRGRERDEFEHQHPNHHFKRIARQPIAQRRHHHDARDDQCQQRRQHREPHQDGRRVEVNVARQRAACRPGVTGGRQHQHQHHRAEVHNAPPGQRPAPSGAPQALGQGISGQVGEHGGIITSAPLWNLNKIPL